MWSNSTAERTSAAQHAERSEEEKMGNACGVRRGCQKSRFGSGDRRGPGAGTRARDITGGRSEGRRAATAGAGRRYHGPGARGGKKGCSGAWRGSHAPSVRSSASAFSPKHWLNFHSSSAAMVPAETALAAVSPGPEHRGEEGVRDAEPEVINHGSSASHTPINHGSRRGITPMKTIGKRVEQADKAGSRLRRSDSNKSSGAATCCYSLLLARLERIERGR